VSFLTALSLTNFRCYEQQKLDGLLQHPVVLFGANGAGKTNILEAISLLTPGRGLRSIKPPEAQKNDAAQPWAIAAKIDTGFGNVQLGTGLDPHNEKRIIRINGQNAKSQSALADHLACVWLTPQMDRLFLDAAGQRRRFLDRLIFAYDPGHSGRLARYDNSLSQRSKLLKDARHTSRAADPSWLSALEQQIAETGIAIAAARIDFIHRLQTACERESHDHFPLARLQVKGTIEELLQQSPALETEDAFKFQLQESREQDSYTGGAATGPHKSDLYVEMGSKSMPAEHCSTGEQKALLIGIIIAHSRLIAAERGAPPVLLLDEIAAHLDENRRAALYEILDNLKTQVFLTGTDQSLFKDITQNAAFFEVKNAKIETR